MQSLQFSQFELYDKPTCRAWTQSFSQQITTFDFFILLGSKFPA